MKYHDWYGLYKESWGQEIHPDAFAHPAKFSRGLIRQIYRHLLESGYIKPGDYVVDCFGGVALGALDAMRNGLHWRGLELEEKFVGLGCQNIELWNGRYAPHFTNWGTAELLQGDSRRLAETLATAGCVVSSPPYAETINTKSNGIDWNRAGRPDRSRPSDKRISPGVDAGLEYGRTPGQLGAMKEGDVSAVISSPPYAGSSVEKNSAGVDWDKQYQTYKKSGGGASFEKFKATQEKHSGGYGSGSGQLAAIPEGKISAVISSPPYADAVSGQGEGPGARYDNVYHSADNATKKSSQNGYGRSDGNLGNMAAVVGSPPYEAIANNKGQQRNGGIALSEKGEGDKYGSDPANIGNDTGETFWTAAREIVAQCYQVLRPGGVAVWVTGNFRRNGEIVDFGKQWLTLCESIGFVGLEHIAAWKYEPHPAQADIFGNVHNQDVHRVSFFRRLDNQKNPGKEILSEDVWIVQKPQNDI